MSDRIIGWIAGVIMLFTYSSISNSILLVSRKFEIDSMYLLLFMCTGASLGALALGKLRRQKWIGKGELKEFLTVCISGIFATCPFIIVFILGPAVMDWAEKAIFPIVLVLLHILFEKQYPKKHVYFGFFVAWTGFIVFMIPSISSTASSSNLLFYVFGLPIVGAIGGAFSVTFMGRMTKKGIGRFYAMSGRYGAPALVLLIISLLFGDASSLSIGGVLASLGIGFFLVNATIYAALVILKHREAITLGLFLMLVPVTTTLIEHVLGLHERSLAFYIGGAVILAGTCFSEFWPDIAKKIGVKSSDNATLPDAAS